MTLAGLSDLMARARDGRYGLLAFNVIPLEYAEAIVIAAEACRAPVVLQVSENTVHFHGGDVRPLVRACRAIAERASVPVAVHLDHATSRELCEAGLEAGVGSLMFDAASLPAAENLRMTAEIVAWGHAHGLTIEAEIGVIGGKDGRHAVGPMTEPDEAAAFVAATGVDALAVQVGTSHAMTTQTAALDLERIARLRDAVAVPLVLHGSSGVPDSTLAAGVAAGLVKINVGTRLNTAFTAAVRARLTRAPEIVDPRPALAGGRDAAAIAAESLLRAVGAVDRASA